MTILLVDDEQDIRTVARLALKTLGGFTVIEAASGAEALEAASSLGVDLVILDVMMPGMDGAEVLRALRANPDTASLPIVFLTAKALSAEVDRLRRLGAQAVIAKPFDPASLPRIVHQVLRGDPAATAGLPSAGRADHAVDQASQVVDPTALRQLAGLTTDGGGDLASELIELFGIHAPAALNQLRQIAAGGDAREAERVAHSLKGSAATLGAVAIADLARTIESLASAGRAGETGTLVDRIEALLPASLDALRRGRSDLPERHDGPLDHQT